MRIRILSYWIKKEFTLCRNWSQSTAEGDHRPHTSSLSPFKILPLREQVCVSSTKGIPSWIHNPLIPTFSEHPSATAQTDSSLPNVEQKPSHNKFTPSIPEQRCSHTPLPAFGIATNQVTAQKNKKLHGNKEGGHFTCTLFPNKKCFFKQSCTFRPSNLF